MSDKKVLYTVVRVNVRGNLLAHYFTKTYKELEEDLEELYPELKGKIPSLCESRKYVLKDSSILLLHKFEFSSI